MSEQNHRPEVGRTVGVDTWAAGEPFCTIICDNGHRRRLIDRIKFTGRDGELLYTAGWRLDDIGPDISDPGTTAEDNPANDETKWRLACSCGIDVVLNGPSLHRLAAALQRVGVSKITLSALAATVS